MLVAHNPKTAFKRSPDKIIVEFETEADLFNACSGTYHVNANTIKGYPSGYNWAARDQAIRKLKQQSKYQETFINPSEDSKESQTTTDSSPTSHPLTELVNNEEHIQKKSIITRNRNHRSYPATGANRIPLARTRSPRVNHYQYPHIIESGGEMEEVVSLC